MELMPLGPVLLIVMLNVNPLREFSFVHNSLYLFVVFAGDWSKSESPSRHFDGKFENPKLATNKYLGLLCLNFNIQFGSLCTWTWHVRRSHGVFHVAEAGHSNLWRVVGCVMHMGEAAIAKGRTTGAVPARPLKALGTA